jgi:hypothetical protein
VRLIDNVNVGASRAFDNATTVAPLPGEIGL